MSKTNWGTLRPVSLERHLSTADRIDVVNDQQGIQWGDESVARHVQEWQGGSCVYLLGKTPRCVSKLSAVDLVNDQKCVDGTDKSWTISRNVDWPGDVVHTAAASRSRRSKRSTHAFYFHVFFCTLERRRGKALAATAIHVAYENSWRFSLAREGCTFALYTPLIASSLSRAGKYFEGRGTI